MIHGYFAMIIYLTLLWANEPIQGLACHIEATVLSEPGCHIGLTVLAYYPLKNNKMFLVVTILINWKSYLIALGSNSNVHNRMASGDGLFGQYLAL